MSELLTEFAPAARAERSTVAAQSLQVSGQPLFRDMLDRVPTMIMVLNSDRQIVYANQAVLRTTEAADMSAIAGMRPGELFHCKHSAETPGGCGTTRFCRFCGAANSILKAQRGQFAMQECRMMAEKQGLEEGLDLRVWASPITVGGEQFTFFVVADIADEKRRDWLEKTFLHDLLNTAAALRGFSRLLNSDSTGPQLDAECAQSIVALAERIVGDIESHRQLVAAENHELQVQFCKTTSTQVLEQVYAAYNNAEMLNGRLLRIAAQSAGVEMETDRTLLARVVGNMVKNALESSAPGEVVTLATEPEGETVRFWVHNPTYIPENVRLQIFNRSFSTKGRGRGLGTYSMKLISERCLGGKVSFTSIESAGTIFVATYPRLQLRR